MACADEELIGKTLSQGEVTITVHSAFYQDQKITEKKLAEYLTECDSANLIGTKAVFCALNNGFIKKEHIIHFGKTPHAIVFKL